jgi:hypothetical protein
LATLPLYLLKTCGAAKSRETLKFQAFHCAGKHAIPGKSVIYLSKISLCQLLTKNCGVFVYGYLAGVDIVEVFICIKRI